MVLFPSNVPSETPSASASAANGAAAAKPSKARAAEQACLSLLRRSGGSFPKLLQTKAFLLKSGLHSNLLVLTSFAAAASFSSSAALAAASSLIFPSFDAHALLLYRDHYDAFLFNTVVRSHAQSDRPGDKRCAVSFFSLMLRAGLLPNKFTFTFLIKACAGLPELLGVGAQAHASAVKFGFGDDHYVQNTLIHMYSADPDGLGSALKVFDRSPRTSPVTWSAMIGGYVRSGCSDRAVALFREMQASGVRPDEVTSITVLGACADLGALELVKWICSYVERGRIQKPLPLCNALLDALAKCGDVEGLVALFERMPEKSIISWTSVIDGLAMHGRGREAVAVFESMKKANVVPDSVAFISVLTACCHAGMVDEGCIYFDSMKRDYKIEPKIEHYGCMVDLFSRAGFVERAIEFVKTMPVEPNPVIWRSLIGACRIHGRLELGEQIARNLLQNEPKHGSNYVVLSNLYALTQKWNEKWQTRRLMSRNGIRKEPGCSLVELDGEIYEFVAGDGSHPQYSDIYEMMQEIEKKLKIAGYMPMTSEVLLDIDEEDKGGTLHCHSEKLAIAFLILRTSPGTMLRVVKNLRVCGDCHLAMKFISKVYERDILMRDRSRFHYFRNGACTCNDFW